MSPTPDPAPPVALPPGPARRRGRRLLLAGLIGLVLVLAAIAGVLATLWRSEATLHWGLTQLPGLRTEGLRGSLAAGRIEADSLDWALPGGAGRLRIRGLRLSGLHWQWQAGGPALRIEEARAIELVFTSGPPAPQPAAVQAPASLRSPLALSVADLQVQRLQIDQQPPLLGLKARLALGAEGGGEHRIEALGFEWERARIDASARIGTAGTLPLQLTLQARSIAAAMPWQGELRAEGPLARPLATLHLRGEARSGHAAPALQARAELAPFAPWPLAALTLSTQALDLAAFSAQAPETALSGEARIQSSGLDQPVLAQLTLHNAAPGRWDQARLPLQRLSLDLAGHARQTDRLQLRQFTLGLADDRAAAGRITGQGQWQGPALDLSLALDGVQPARLDSRAAPLRLQGPVSLQLRQLPTAGAAAGGPPPRLALQARLTGQSLDRSGLPVQLTLAAEGDASHWRLTQAEAAAGGARARLSGEARREAAGWRLQAQAALQQFDPLPWWRGAADSPWRRGPHRLHGTLETALLWRDAPPAGGSAGTATAALRRAEGRLSLDLADSQLAGVPVAARLALDQQAGRLSWDGRLQVAANHLTSAGDWPLAEGRQRGRVQLQAPALPAAAPLWRLLAETVPASAG
jgi:translocation and assembly module TamB